MSQLIFAFTIDSKTKEATFSGNIGTEEALAILQQIVIAEAVNKANKNIKQEKRETKENG